MLLHPLRLIVSGLITLAVLGFVGFKAQDAFDQADDALEEASAKASDEGSLLRGAALADALATLKDETDGAKDALRITVYPTYLSAEVSTGSEDEAKGYKVQKDGDVQPFGVTLTGPGKLADNVFPIADIDPKALDAVVAAAAEQDPSLGLDDVTHAIAGIDSISGKADWKVYFGGSTYYTANLDGTDVRKGGAPATTTAVPDAGDVEDAVEDASEQADEAVSDAQEVTDCIAKAAGDVAAIQACTD